MLYFLRGLSMFLLGIEGSKKGLENLVSYQIKKFIQGLTANHFRSIVTGALITAIMQSSSGFTIIIISLMEAGLLTIGPAIGLVLGANIGTTITVQIVSLPILDTAPYLIIGGIFFMLLAIFLSKEKLFYLGLVLFSFGIIFQGLELMTSFFQRPVTKKLVQKILAASSQNKYLAVLLGFFITAIVQSSSLITGISVSLAKSSLITLPTAVAIALGSNIGTCITAFIATINSSQEAKSLAKGHFIFNLIGVIAVLPFFDFFLFLLSKTSADLVRQIANAHTYFNLFNVLLFLPFFDTFVRYLGGSDYGNN